MLKFDHPPLLAPGKHCLSLVQIEQLCVSRFEGESRRHREKLFYAFEDFYQRILVASIVCDVVLDGSFITEKPKPSDVDVKVYIDVDAHERLSDEQFAQYIAISEPHYIAGVDSTAWVTYPRGHECFGCALDPRNRGEDYGLENSETWLKGYVVLMPGETDVGVRIRC
jgi:hypothetical protein